MGLGTGANLGRSFLRDAQSAFSSFVPCRGRTKATRDQSSSSDSVYLNVGMVGTANSSSPILSPTFGVVSFMSREMVAKISSSFRVLISSLLERSFGLGSGMSFQLKPSPGLPRSPWQWEQ